MLNDCNKLRQRWINRFEVAQVVTDRFDAMQRIGPGQRCGRLALLLLLVCLSGNAFAHHSFAMFDQTKLVTLHGVVKDFRWTNPHVFIQLLANTDSGVDEEWSIEMTSPEHLARAGWRPGTLKAGDKVTLVIHPMRESTRGGQYQSGIGPAGPLALRSTPDSFSGPASLLSAANR